MNNCGQGADRLCEDLQSPVEVGSIPTLASQCFGGGMVDAVDSKSTSYECGFESHPKYQTTEFPIIFTIDL